MPWPKGVKRSRDLRPAKNPQETAILEAVENIVSDVAEVKVEPVKSEPTKKAGKYQPYNGKESLPAYTTERGRVIPGEPRYAVVRGDGKRYKLLAYRRTPAGVERTLVRVFTNGGADKPLFDTLKKLGVPGAF